MTALPTLAPRAPVAVVVVPQGLALAWGGGQSVVPGDPVQGVRTLLSSSPRLVWWSARATAAPLVAAGLHVPACWDLGAVGRVLHGVPRDDPAAVWAAAHELPEPAPLKGTESDLFD
ncbi:MAG: hypothetical protein H7323_13705, partial [Frankiales bacterium]|nr:hypothetical protein [Frankiales bacterium]